MIPSVSIWPDNEALANDSCIPLYIGLNCFDESDQLHILERQKLGTCSRCHTPVTKISESSNGKNICPICKMDLTQISRDQKENKNFAIEIPAGNEYSFNVIFVIDGRGTSDQYFHSLASASNAINVETIPPTAKCGFCILYKNNISFIKSLNGTAFFIDMPLQINLYNAITINNILINASDLRTVMEAAFTANSSFSNTPIEEPVFFQNFFNVPPKCFVKLITFTSTSVVQCANTNTTIDVIGSKPKSDDSDSICISDDKTSSQMQIQEYIKRVFTEPIHFDAKIEIFYLPTIRTNPSQIKSRCVMPGTLFFTKVEYQWVSYSFSSLPFVVLSRSIVHKNNKFVHRIRVFSESFPITHSNVILLQSVNPAIIAAVKLQQLPGVIKMMLDYYNNKVIPYMPGPPRNDNYFDLFPNLSWLIRYYKNMGSWITNNPLIIQPDLISSMFFPCVSFWMNVNEKIEEMASEFLFGHPADLEPIVVIDMYYKILIFADCELEKESVLVKEMQKRAKRRFPVPSIKKRERLSAKNYFPLKMKWTDENFHS